MSNNRHSTEANIGSKIKLDLFAHLYFTLYRLKEVMCSESVGACHFKECKSCPNDGNFKKYLADLLYVNTFDSDILSLAAVIPEHGSWRPQLRSHVGAHSQARRKIQR